MFYAIRHKPTSYFLPQLRKAKGYTWTEPTKECIPRLFKSKHAAAVALSYWLKGSKGYKLTDNFGRYEMQTTPVPSRIKEDMEIVTIEIRICQ